MAVFSEHTFYQSIIKTLPKVFLHANYTTENNTIKLTSSMPLRIVFLIAFYLLSAVLLFSGIAKIMDPLSVLVLIADACPPVFKEGFGNIVKSSFGWGMILRNTMF